VTVLRPRTPRKLSSNAGLGAPYTVNTAQKDPYAVLSAVLFKPEPTPKHLRVKYRQWKSRKIDGPYISNTDDFKVAELLTYDDNNPFPLIKEKLLTGISLKKHINLKKVRTYVNKLAAEWSKDYYHPRRKYRHCYVVRERVVVILERELRHNLIELIINQYQGE